MLKAKKKVIVILGPTSSGKSEVAIKLARKLNGEIISADSRQIYREMDIGTGKVPKSKCKNPCLAGRQEKSKLQIKNKKLDPYWSGNIAHYLIDIVNPKNNYNVSYFKKDAEKIIKNILSRGKLPIICGGTGFWIKAIVDNIDFPEVKPNRELRKRMEKKSAEKLFKMLQKLDPERAKDIDRKNKVRLIRALEICEAIGKVPKIDPKPVTHNSQPFNFLQVGIKIDKEKLHKKIKKRLEKRFKQGIIREVVKLHESGLSWKKIQSFGLGYYWIPLYLQRKIDKKELFEKVYQAEKDYAKRQITWFQRDKRIKWIENYREIEKEIRSFIKD